ncbi:MAG: hypothetical protein RL701_723, partial [Pseudomonadota bacterium]
MRERLRNLRLRALGPMLCTALACTATSACGDDDDAPPAVTPPTDSGAAGGRDDEPIDANIPRPRPDSGPSTIPAGEPEAGLAGTCAADSNKIFTVATRDQPFSSAPLAVDPVNSDFVLPYVAKGACLDAVHWASMHGDAATGGPTSTIAADSCALVRDASATSVGDHWLIASIDNRDGAYDVWVEPYSGELVPQTAATRLSENVRIETSVALTTLQSGDKLLLAYADEHRGASYGLYVRPLDAAGKPTGDTITIEESTTLAFTGITLKPLSDGAALAYVRYSFDYSTSEIVLVRLNAAGVVQRSPWVLAQNAGPSASVAISADARGSAGVVYSRAESSTGRQIWFQQLDGNAQAAVLRDGKTPAPAIRVVSSPQRGVDVSLVKLRTSYVMAYRALPQPTDSETRAKLRVYFLDDTGNVIGNSDVGYTS